MCETCKKQKECKWNRRWRERKEGMRGGGKRKEKGEGKGRRKHNQPSKNLKVFGAVPTGMRHTRAGAGAGHALLQKVGQEPRGSSLTAFTDDEGRESRPAGRRSTESLGSSGLLCRRSPGGGEERGGLCSRSWSRMPPHSPPPPDEQPQRLLVALAALGTGAA